jgi:hypothetical protein
VHSQLVFGHGSGNTGQNESPGSDAGCVTYPGPFVPEPLFAKTGRGNLKSDGVATLQKIKSSLRRKSAGEAG